MGGVFSSSSSSSSSSSLSTQREVTWSELSQHNKPNDCWTVVRQEVYDVTKFANHHPGGPRTIYMACGKDCTEVYNHVHPKVDAKVLLFKHHIGKTIGEAPEEQVAGRKHAGEDNHSNTSTSSSTTSSSNMSYEPENKQEVIVKDGEVW